VCVGGGSKIVPYAYMCGVYNCSYGSTTHKNFYVLSTGMHGLQHKESFCELGHLSDRGDGGDRSDRGDRE
jgi:hypothetical protein